MKKSVGSLAIVLALLWLTALPAFAARPAPGCGRRINTVMQQNELAEMTVQKRQAAELRTAARAAAAVQPAMREATFTAYAYCPCKKCCGPAAQGITASGTRAAAGRTIAVDPGVIPLGTRVTVNGREYVAEDTGSGIRSRTIDIFFATHTEALQWGKRTVTVRWPA